MQNYFSPKISKRSEQLASTSRSRHKKGTLVEMLTFRDQLAKASIRQSQTQKIKEELS
jgi:hypothetical protein